MGEFGPYRGETVCERRIPGWRGIASAWAIALLIIGLFAGFGVLASWHPAPAQDVGVVIPRHNPACDAAAPSALPKGCPDLMPEPLGRNDVPWG